MGTQKFVLIFKQKSTQSTKKNDYRRLEPLHQRAQQHLWWRFGRGHFGRKRRWGAVEPSLDLGQIGWTRGGRSEEDNRRARQAVQSLHSGPVRRQGRQVHLHQLQRGLHLLEPLWRARRDRQARSHLRQG